MLLRKLIDLDVSLFEFGSEELRHKVYNLFFDWKGWKKGKNDAAPKGEEEAKEDGAGSEDGEGKKGDIESTNQGEHEADHDKEERKKL